MPSVRRSLVEEDRRQDDPFVDVHCFVTGGDCFGGTRSVHCLTRANFHSSPVCLNKVCCLVSSRKSTTSTSMRLLCSSYFSAALSLLVSVGIAAPSMLQ